MPGSFIASFSRAISSLSVHGSFSANPTAGGLITLLPPLPSGSSLRYVSSSIFPGRVLRVALFSDDVLLSVFWNVHNFCVF